VEFVIRSIVVIGTGLIGTSVALAARRCGISVFLVDRDPAVARAAASLGAGVSAHPRRPVDLAVVAVPPGAVGAAVASAQAARLAHSYTDVASVKEEPERAVRRLAPDPCAYVGGHPMAGRERSGPAAARVDLFAGRTWALTPSELTDPAALACARELARACGAVPVQMTSRDHDAAVALTSHAPHLVASLMAARLRLAGADASALAGQGLRDVTRIAAGDAGLWADILRANARAIRPVVRELLADLTAVASALDELADPDGGARPAELQALRDLLERGIEGVARIPAAPGVSLELIDGRPGM
jgi:prephenate dehydrogenase